MKIGITAPVYLTNPEHKKYLDLTTRSIVSADHDIVWLPCENYVHPVFIPLAYTFDHEPESIKILYPTGNQSVSQAWNKGIEAAGVEECDYVIVINTDIVFKSNAIDRLVAFAENHPEAVMWTMSEYVDLSNLENCPEDENFSEHPHFSCFMVKPEILDTVGHFDENFTPAYCEDASYHAEMTFKGQKAYVYGGARFYHFGSRTIKSDRELWDKNTQTFPKCQQYFLEKFGHPIVNDTDKMMEAYYKHPYGVEELSWKKPHIIPDFWDLLRDNNVEHLKELPVEKVLDYIQERGLR